MKRMGSYANKAKLHEFFPCHLDYDASEFHKLYTMKQINFVTIPAPGVNILY